MLFIITLIFFFLNVGNSLPIDPQLPHYVPVSDHLTGNLFSVGANTIDEITLHWIQSFRRVHPDVEVVMEARNSASASQGFLTPLGDPLDQMGPCAREVMPAEMANFVAKYGYELTPVRVGGGSYKSPGSTHSIVFYVNKKNPINELTFEQLAEVYARDGKITTWGQLGAGGDWANKPITLWGLVLPNGIAYYIQLNVLKLREFRTNINTVTTKDGVPALDAMTFAVGNDPYAIGYAGPSNLNPGVKALRLGSANNSFIGPSFESVFSRKYPLSRYIYIYVNKPPNQDVKPNVKEFLRLALSYEGQKTIADESVFLPLPASAIVEELQLINSW